MSDRHLELGVFAPTIGCSASFGTNAFVLVSSAEQRTEPTFEYNLRVAELLDQAGPDAILSIARDVKPGIHVATAVFDGASEEAVKEELARVGLPRSGQAVLFGGLKNKNHRAIKHP